jgi:hypothetical protein
MDGGLLLQGAPFFVPDVRWNPRGGRRRYLCGAPR